MLSGAGNNGFPQLISENFDEPILYAPARMENKKPCNSLKIITCWKTTERPM